jgi:hypothetical protein
MSQSIERLASPDLGVVFDSAASFGKVEALLGSELDF